MAERLIKINGFEIATDVPDEACKTYSFLYGEMGQVIKTLKLTPTTNPTKLTATAACHARNVGVRHINIVLNSDGTTVSADDSVRNWMRREVHCKR